MSEFSFLVAELENGSTDFVSCISSRPELSHDEQFQLAIADLKYRIGRGESCSSEYYTQLLPWLSSDPVRRQELIASEFELRLGRDSPDALLSEFQSRYPHLGESLIALLRQRIRQWNEQPLSGFQLDGLVEDFENQISAGSCPSIEAYLERSPSASRADLLRELLLVETYHRLRSGSILDWEDYHRRFPSDTELIRLVQNNHVSSIDASSTPSIPTIPPVRPTSPNDLSGSFISGQTVGDSRQGRYRFTRKLGKGAYGVVYLAYDMELRRQVAVKIPNREALSKMVHVESYAVEAQTVAALDHPHIVTVFDVVRTLDGSVYIVSKFIAGCSLADLIKRNTLDYRAIAKLIVPIAEALHHAHQRRLIHRDIKPANILIEEATGTPYVADFGLAIREEDYLQDGRIAGTPAYMSPEQVRGEGHRLDGRSDLFSLGVVMYLMLTGRLPFLGQTLEELSHPITTLEPPPPRRIKGDIPAELERICLKLLRKRASERYANGLDLAQDLRTWLTPSTIEAFENTSQKITPRGLRSFSADDAGYFGDLLPGPRNREGLPESIAFWKDRIEQRDPDQTFTVGLLYGPSGCGKTSLVKAGLIPHLSSEVIAIYIEATSEETERRLLRQLHKRFPELPSDLGLVEIVEKIRRSDGPKVVFVIDQFEQWLYSHRVDQEGDLVRALRQCDGKRLQAVLMIRDDFYLAAARLMNQIDVPIVTDQNFKLVDLFDVEHAKRVLIRLGESYDKLPVDVNSQSPAHTAFIRQVIEGLSENGKVVPVRLSLLADMLKTRDWIPSTLESIGGLNGIGVSFLEETFASSHADARHRAHQLAVRGVLRALLPDSGTDIKGSMRSEESLMEASGYGHRRQDFQDLMRILDGEMRLVTPTDPEGNDSQSSNNASPRRYYQLTHDYLIPSLREWLTRKQRETEKGRAELKLAERAAAWSASKENKQLPTLVEWMQICYWTDKRHRTAHERALMQTSTRFHSRNWGGSILTILILGGVIGYLFHQQNLTSLKNEIQAELDSLPNTIEPRLSGTIERLVSRNRPDLIHPKLAEEYGKAKSESRDKLLLAFALASFGQFEYDYLISQIDAIDDENTGNLIDALGKDRQKAIQRLKDAAGDCRSKDLWRRKTRLAMAGLGIGDATLARETCEFEERSDHGLRTVFIDEFSHWELDLKTLVANVQDTESPALRSAVCLGLGQIPSNRFSEENISRVKNLAISWFEFPDSSTHSAAAWLMRQWKLDEPQIANAKRMIAGRDWFVNSQETTFVRIKPRNFGQNVNASKRSDRPEQPYWLAAREVTRAEFETFMKDDSYQGAKPTDWKGCDTSVSPSPGHPVQYVNWFDAVMYCNWLSTQERRKPAYRIIGKEKLLDTGNREIEVDKWVFDESSDGYRLPNEVEWEYACRAGSQTIWSSGGDEKLLAAYCQMNQSKPSAVGGAKLPNAWGLHDMSGNVWEWCENFYNEKSSYRVTRGGSWYGNASFSASSSRSGWSEVGRDFSIGFRLALSSLDVSEVREGTR